MNKLLVLGLLIGLAGCGAEPPTTIPVQLRGTISAPEGVSVDEKVYVSLYHAWALEGELRHPVEFIESFETLVGAYTHAFDYPETLGEGLLVYAWLDTDGDGVLCTPTGRTDIAGLTEADGFPDEPLVVDIELTQPCAGPDWFYPPAPGTAGL